MYFIEVGLILIGLWLNGTISTSTPLAPNHLIPWLHPLTHTHATCPTHTHNQHLIFHGCTLFLSDSMVKNYINFKKSSSGKPSSVILLPREQHQPFWYGHWTLVIRQRIFQIFINWVNYLFDEDCCVSGEGRQDSDPLFSMLMTLQVFSLRNRILMF